MLLLAGACGAGCAARGALISGSLDIHDGGEAAADSGRRTGDAAADAGRPSEVDAGRDGPPPVGVDAGPGTVADAGIMLPLLPLPSGRPLRVMPLGDSITAGYPTADGYRLQLWQRAQNAGMDLQLVGSVQGGDASLPQQDHEGHVGWTIGQLDGSVAGFLASGRPDVVLLMIGTNDVFQQIDLGVAPDRLRKLLEDIVAAAPGARVVVGTIPPLRTTARLGDVPAYNAALPAIVGALAAAGRSVAFAEVGSTLTLDDIGSDNIHPSPAGYLKLGDAWFAALSAQLAGR